MWNLCRNDIKQILTVLNSCAGSWNGTIQSFTSWIYFNLHTHKQLIFVYWCTAIVVWISCYCMTSSLCWRIKNLQNLPIIPCHILCILFQMFPHNTQCSRWCHLWVQSSLCQSACCRLYNGSTFHAILCHHNQDVSYLE